MSLTQAEWEAREVRRFMERWNISEQEAKANVADGKIIPEGQELSPNALAALREVFAQNPPPDGTETPFVLPRLD